MSGLAKALTEDQVLLRVMERLHEQIYSQHETIEFLMDKRLEKRTWVGLTDEEIKEIIGPWGDTPIKGYTRKLFDQIETKLREKNI
jgi:hypothetical protein